VFDELPRVAPVQLGPLPPGFRPILALALAPGDKTLAVASGAVIELLDVSRAERPVLGRLAGHVEAVQSLAWLPDGRQLVSGGFRQLRVWEVATAREVATIAGTLAGNITALAVTADGKTLFAADGIPGTGGFIHRVDLAARKLTGTWRAHDDVIYALRLSPAGDILLSAAADKLAKTWRVADGALVAAYEGHTNHVLAAAFNHDASLIATAGADKEVKVWDAKAREQTAVLGDKRSVPTALAWTPDGKSLVAVTEKGGGGIYSELVRHTGGQRSDTGKERKLAAVDEMLYTVAVTADGGTIYAGSDDGRVHVWDGTGKAVGKVEVK
jgi:WD40 repeat protein